MNTPITAILSPITSANEILDFIENITSSSENGSLIPNTKIETLARAARESNCSVTYAASKNSKGDRQEAIQFQQR